MAAAVEGVEVTEGGINRETGSVLLNPAAGAGEHPDDFLCILETGVRVRLDGINRDDALMILGTFAGSEPSMREVIEALKSCLSSSEVRAFAVEAGRIFLPGDCDNRPGIPCTIVDRAEGALHVVVRASSESEADEEAMIFAAELGCRDVVEVVVGVHE